MSGPSAQSHIIITSYIAEFTNEDMHLKRNPITQECIQKDMCL